MDWTATILSLAGAKIDRQFPLDGMDILPVIQGKKAITDRTLYWRTFQRVKHKAIRDGNWKWLQDENGNEYLFNLIEDPSEKNNLNEKYPDTFQRLKIKYATWEKTVLQPIPL